VVEAHGGHVWMTRNEPRGVTFHFSLKAVEA
jgi:signal transduction histidine kinase